MAKYTTPDGVVRNCVARDHTKPENKCGEPCEPGFKYCPKHSNRRGALEEREDKAFEKVVEASTLVMDEPEEPKEPEKSQTVQIPAQTTEVLPKGNSSQASVFDKVLQTLEAAAQFEEEAREQYQERLQLAKQGDPEALRYQDKAGAEQTRGEVSTYERAMDRTIRIVTAAAKLNIDNQALNINKLLKETIQSVVMRVFQRMELSPDQIAQARQYLVEEFSRQEKASKR